MVVETAINLPPYFEPSLNEFQVIYRTYESEQWEYKLPPTYDPENDPISISFDLNAIGSFMYFDFEDGNLILKIDDLSSQSIQSGFYQIQVEISDG